MNNIKTEIKENQLVEIKKLNEQGLTVPEISKITGISDANVRSSIKRLGLTINKCKRTLLNVEDITKLANQGLKDSEIAKMFNMTTIGIYTFRRRNNITREPLNIAKTIDLTQRQKEILIGTMLGDSSMELGKHCINPRMSCAHSPKQRELSELLTKEFESIGAKCTYRKTNVPDPRNGLLYETYTMRCPANGAFLPYYHAFYKNGKKVIPFELLDDFTDLSLAYLFMDDGVGGEKYTISTNCFELDEVCKFADFLKDKFGLNCSVFNSSHILHIKASSRDLFTQIIKPHICECCMYKLML